MTTKDWAMVAQLVDRVVHRAMLEMVVTALVFGSIGFFAGWYLRG